MSYEDALIEALKEELALADWDKEKCSEKDPFKFDEAKGYARGLAVALEMVKKHIRRIVHSYMDDNPKCGNCSRRKFYQTGFNDGSKMQSERWIPVSERLPKEKDSIFAKLKGTDLWNDAMFEKKSEKVYVTIEFEDGKRETTASYTLDGKWKIEKERGIVKKKVVAWKPFPQPYKGDLLEN